MANSVVKVMDVTNNMTDDGLLLLVDEDGTVTPNRKTVDHYLSSKAGPTNLQIMHIDKSDPKGIDVIVDNVTYIPDSMEVVNEEDIYVKGENSSDVRVVALNLYNVKLDHDYTPLTSPRRLSPSPDDDDELTKTLSILHGNEQSPPEDSTPNLITVPSKSMTPKISKAINIISSITIPPPDGSSSSKVQEASKSANENISASPTVEQKSTATKTRRKAKILHTAPKIVPKQTKVAAKKPVKKEESSEEEESGEDAESDEDDENEFDDGDFEMEMDDDENDSDFDIKEEIAGKKQKKVPKKVAPQTRKQKRISESAAVSPTQTPKIRTQPKEKSAKDQTATTKCGTKAEKVAVKEQANESLGELTEVKTTDAVAESKSEKETEIKQDEAKLLEKKQPKKKKEPPKPIPGDFALFSTPDIIRKVGGKDPVTPGTPEPLPTTPKSVKNIGEANKPSTPGRITHESRSKSTSETSSTPSKHTRLSMDEKSTRKLDDVKEKPVLRHQRMSSGESKSNAKHKRSKSTEENHNKSEPASATSERKLSGSERNRSTSELGKSVSKYDHSPSKHSSRHSSESQEPIPTAEDIRAIIMNEDTKTYTTNTIPIPDVPVQLINNDQDSTTLNLDAAGLDLDQSILDNINNDMISEDILYQVAKQLVSNTELQSAIDKGINEGVLDTSNIEEVMDTSQSSNSSIMDTSQSNIIKQGTQIVRPDGRILVLPPIERPTTRSRNKRKEAAPAVKASFKTVHKPLDDEHVSGNELDSSGDEQEESEDDPNKLWCICNQPHNNRFMICCDTCEEWYHGKCVNITKAMGQQMEAEGKEWICLFCKDSSLKRPVAAARRIRKASQNSRQSTDSNSSLKKPEKGATSMPVLCVVCQKAARKNSIYCSESCILAHAQGVERVVVFERTTGNMLTGTKAPSAANLDHWLKEHPGYEVVRSAGKVVTTKVKPGQMTQSKLKLVKNPNNEGVSLAVHQKGVNIGVLKHLPKQASQTDQPVTPKATKIIKVLQKDTPKESKIKLIQAQPAPQPQKVKDVVTPSKPNKIQIQTLLAPKLEPTTPTTKTPKKEVPKEIKQKTPKSKPKEEPAVATPVKQEDIRDNVQKTIIEQLCVRLKGSDVKLTDEEVKNISTEIENELYKCFGDTGQKYKNKYRSLIFNIKDSKNQTLWRRICEKSISSYELVRLSPDDMASQELAKWREQEAKHQLDMIKKSEIELLNCNRQYVLKTHKGEEVLEDNRSGNKVDNTEIIKSLTEGSTLNAVTEPKRNSSKDKDRDKRSSSNKDKSRDKSRHSSKDRKDKDRSRRSSSKDRDRSRKRSRSRDKSRHGKKKKEMRTASKSRERSREKDDSRDRGRHRKSSHKTSRHKKTSLNLSTDNLDKRSKEILEQLNKIVPPVEGTLWKHVTQEDIIPGNAPIDSDSDHEVPSSTVTIPTPPRVEAEDIPSQSPEDSKASVRLKDVEMEKEGGSSPIPKNTEIWSGTINMVDVAQISITANEVSGDCTGLGKELSKNLDIVGRISPETVWDYIGKMKTSNSKIISLIRLNATNVEEQMPYLALYSYLSSRNRLGVVKSTDKAIKDFYILPLASQKPIPQALLPINGPGFEEARPALLLGIIVRDRRKRTSRDIMPLSVTPSKKSRIEVHVVQTRSYTPPPMPPELSPAPMPPLPPPPPKVDPRLTKLSTPPLPPMAPALLDIVKEMPPLPTSSLPSKSPQSRSPSPVAQDDDEPYSPEDSDPDTTVTEMASQSAIPASSTGVNVTLLTQATMCTETYPVIPGLEDTATFSAKKIDIQRQMEELNKQIELQKSEITSITKNIATAESEIVGSALASIALPSNLQQILDSIKTIGSTPTTASNDAPVKEPPIPPQSDLTIPLMIPKTFSRPLKSPSPCIASSSTSFHSKFTLPSSDEKASSVLSSLSEEDLIKKAAEMLNEERNNRAAPPLPKAKGSNVKVSLPPVPGVDD